MRARVSTETTEPAKTTPNDAAKAESEKQETVTEPKAADIKQGEPKATPADKPVVKPADKPKASAATPKPAQPKPAPATAEKEAPRQEVKVEQPQAQPKRLPVLLELGADKCIPCKKMKPIIDELEKEYEDRVDVRFIDVWKTEGVAEKYNIRSIPTQIFFDEDGNEHFRHQGFFSKEDILKVFAEMGVK